MQVKFLGIEAFS